jgi:CPA2 family monovalent cation:H+ antiporter-2
MADAASPDQLVDYLILITAAVVVSTLFRRFNIPTVLAYLFVGLLLGPTAAGVISDIGTMQILAEFGVVFLLFSLGLEFSLARMIALRRLVFGLGGWQVLLSSLLIFSVARLLNATQEEAIVIAGALALSSTAVVSKELVVRNELNMIHGQQSMAVLLFQDIAAVVFLIMIPFLAGTTDDSIGLALGVALLKGLLLFVMMLAIGKYLLPRLFDEVAKARSDELFVLTVLMVSLLAAALTHSAGLSMALGAFIAGMMLSETHYKHQVEADIRPFRDLLLGLFFVSVGMIVDFQQVVQNWHWIALLTLLLMMGKTILIAFLAYRYRRDYPSALLTGVYLAQGGEFGFALFALGQRYELISGPAAAVVITSVIMSITLTPYLMTLARRHVNSLAKKADVSAPVTRTENLTDACAELTGHAIVCGFGRVGQTVARFLRLSSLPLVAIDNDAIRVSEASRAGEPIFYGNAERIELMKALGLERASLVVITYNDPDKSSHLIRMIRETGSMVPVLVRTSDDSSLEKLKLAGATEVVPETLEASLMLVSQVLTLMNVPADVIHQHIEDTRRSRYKLLHGCYPGLKSRIITADGVLLEKLHAVTLPEGAWACNRALEEVRLESCSIDAIHRGQTTIDAPTPLTRLLAGDTLILHGSAGQVEKAENLLLGG